MENPFIHQGGQGRSYVTTEAEAAGADIQHTAAVPTHLAAILILAGAGLWGLKKAGFKFVATAGAKGGFS